MRFLLEEAFDLGDRLLDVIWFIFFEIFVSHFSRKFCIFFFAKINSDYPLSFYSILIGCSDWWHIIDIMIIIHIRFI
jgi:hypothetical protein